MSNDKWISVETMLPTNGMVVDTKIDDQNGVRNEQKMERNGKALHAARAALAQEKAERGGT